MDVISLFTTIIGVTGLVGGAVGYFAKGRGDSIIAYQAREIELRNGTITNLEKDKTALEATNLAKDATIEELKRNNAYLQKLGQGSPQLKKLTIAVENQTKVISQLIKENQKK